jgi:hypothetical protein
MYEDRRREAITDSHELIACDSGAPIVGSDPLPFSPTLTYSARHDIYSLAWTTDAAWDGTCRQVAIRLSDGYTYRLNYRF